MIITLIDISLLVFLLIFLIILRKAIFDRDFFKPVKQYFSFYNRKVYVNRYLSDISKKPGDPQKMMLKEVTIFIIFSIIMLIISSKTIFFTAVVSGSMTPTFERNDLVLMQNFDRTYKVGDIIMFIEPLTNRPTTHRIALIDHDVIRTAGDFSGMLDVWKINRKNIVAKAIIINGNPIVIKRYGRFFIIDSKDQNLALFGQDYRTYALFFQVIKLYGYVIVVICVVLYIALTFRQKSWKNR